MIASDLLAISPPPGSRAMDLGNRDAASFVGLLTDRGT
jgi:hypothetical protein